MKLFLFTGTDENDVETNLDWFIVAPDENVARTLWKDAVEGFRDAPGADSEVTHVFEILPDVTGTPYAGDARSIPWEEIRDLA
jgi:hypothetical protein